MRRGGWVDPVIELPETRDLFYPCEPERVDYGAYEAVRIGRDLGADIVLMDSGRVVARLDENEFLINNSAWQYQESLVIVGNARDAFVQ